MREKYYKSPILGKNLEFYIKEGDEIEEDTLLFILSIGNQTIPAYSNFKGIIKEIFPKKDIIFFSDIIFTYLIEDPEFNKALKEVEQYSDIKSLKDFYNKTDNKKTVTDIAIMYFNKAQYKKAEFLFNCLEKITSDNNFSQNIEEYCENFTPYEFISLYHALSLEGIENFKESKTIFEIILTKNKLLSPFDLKFRFSEFPLLSLKLSEISLERAKFLEMKGQYNDAVEIYELLLIKNLLFDNQPHEELIVYNLAKNLVKIKKYENAKILFEKLNKKHDNIFYLSQEAEIYEELSDYEEAIKLYEKAIEINPIPELFFAKAKTLYKWGLDTNYDDLIIKKIFNEALNICDEILENQFDIEYVINLKNDILKEL